MRSERFASYWASRNEALVAVQGWEAFSAEPLPRTERCSPEKNGGQKWRVVEEPDPDDIPDPLKYALFTDLDWLCRGLAGGDIALHERLYRSTDLVRVMEHLAATKADTITQRVAAHIELLRTLE